MEKARSLNSLLAEWQRTRKRLENVQDDTQSLKTRYGTIYWKRELDAAVRAEEHWRKKLNEFGSGKLIKVSGKIAQNAPQPGVQIIADFELFMVGVQMEDVEKYVRAQAMDSFEGILLETIELKEFQTGRLIINKQNQVV